MNIRDNDGMMRWRQQQNNSSCLFCSYSTDIYCLNTLHILTLSKTLWGRHDYSPHLQRVKLREVKKTAWHDQPGVDRNQLKEKRLPGERRNVRSLEGARNIWGTVFFLFFLHSHMPWKGNLYSLPHFQLLSSSINRYWAAWGLPILHIWPHFGFCLFHSTHQWPSYLL